MTPFDAERRRGHSAVAIRFCRRGGWSDVQVGVVGQFAGPPARPLGKVAFVNGLEPPRDAFDQVLQDSNLDPSG